MINIQHISKSFGKLQVLKDIHCTFDKGKVISILGPNGSGKTTLIKCLLGMVIADSGDITVSGQSIHSGVQYRSQIGYMPQIGRYPENMRMEQVFDMMQDLRNENQRSFDTDLMDRYQLQKMFSKPMRTLSGGTRQKVSAALAFLFNPDVYVLDEPTAGLDPLAAEVLKDKIHQAKSIGKTVLITSHILSEVDELADEIMYMQDGRVLFHLPIKQMKEYSGESRLGKALTYFIHQSVQA